MNQTDYEKLISLLKLHAVEYTAYPSTMGTTVYAHDPRMPKKIFHFDCKGNYVTN